MPLFNPYLAAETVSSMAKAVRMTARNKNKTQEKRLARMNSIWSFMFSVLNGLEKLVE